MLNWNGLDDTIECVEALRVQSASDFALVLYDNGSDNDEASRLERRFRDEPRVEIRRFERNHGFTGGMNRAMTEVLEQIPGDYLVLLNNDTIPAPDWLEHLLAAAAEADCVASRLVRHDNPEVLDNAGHIMLNTGEIMPRGAGRPARDYDQPAELIGACAGAALYRQSMLKDIGLFDDFFGSGYEDAELGLRAYQAGYTIRYAPRAVVRHKVSQSVDKIRTEAYAIKIQRDIEYTYFKLVPIAVMITNLPFTLARIVLVPLVALLVGRVTLARVQWKALRQTLADRDLILSARRAAGPYRRRPATQLLRAQRFFLGTYLSYFRRYVVGRKATVFERRRSS